MSDSRPSWRLEEWTWEDVTEYIETTATPAVIVPIGSTEQHGPHLPLGVDTMQADRLSREIAERAELPVAPTIPYGDAQHHLGFSGTIALSTETTTAVLVDIYESVAAHGFDVILTVNGHRLANLTAIDTATKRVASNHPELSFATLDPLRFGIAIHEELREGDPEDGMHGGEFETSFMQFHAPELVREEKFERQSSEQDTPFLTNDLISREDRVLTPPPRHSPKEGHLGHLGDPTLASPEKGEELWERLIEDAVVFLEAFRSD